MDRAKLKKARQFKDNVFNAFVWISAALTVGFLFWIIWYILSNGLQHVDWNFITDNYTRTGDEHGIFPMIVSTIYMVIASIAVAAPLGIMTAIYLTEYAKSRQPLGESDSILYRIPCRYPVDHLRSVWYDFLRGNSWSWFLDSIGCTDAKYPNPASYHPYHGRSIDAVPQTYREGSYGLGASKIYTIWRLILPSAMPGILTSVILSIGRVIGESAPVFLTAGMVARIPDSLLDSGRTLTVHLYKLTTELFTIEEWNQAYGTATVLIVVVLLINMVTKLIARRFNTATY